MIVKGDKNNIHKSNNNDNDDNNNNDSNNNNNNGGNGNEIAIITYFLNGRVKVN